MAAVQGLSKTMNMTKKNDKDGMQRILAAAVDEFCRAGLAGAKLDVIAMQAGVSKQLIHHYFRTKSELYVAVMNEVTAEQIASLIALDYESCEPEAALRLFLNQSFDIFLKWPVLAGLYNDQGVYGGEHMPECRDLISLSPELMKRLNAALKRGQAKAIFRQNLDINQVIAAALMVVIGGFTHGPLLSSLTPMDFSKPENIENWRLFSIDFALSALAAR